MAHRIFKYIFIFILFGHLNILMAQASPSYNNLIASADTYFAKKDYYNAKTTYQLALQIDANAEYPKNKIKEIIRNLNDELELRLIYEEKMQFAEEAYVEKDYQKAILYYKEAAVAIDYEEQPKLEIARIEKEWEDVVAQQNNFDLLLTQAEVAKQSQDFVSAIEKLEQANEIFSSKPDVLTEIAQLKLLLKQQNATIEEFNRLVADADKRMEQNSFQAALKNYEAAAALIGNDSYVESQLVVVKESIKIEDAYNKIIEKADGHYIALELNQATKAYEQALNIWPEKTYPSNMLAKLGEAHGRRAKDLEQLNREYESSIASADKQFNEQKYKLAYGLYENALILKPEEGYPKKQIQRINKLLGSGSITINCEIQENGRALSNAFIEVTENGSSKEIAVSRNGKHKLKLRLNSNYQLKFKKDGYIHKIFAINTNIPEEDDQNSEFSSYLLVELFPICGIDLSLFDEPLIYILYQPSEGEFIYEFTSAEAAMKRAEQLKNDCVQLYAEEKKLKEYNAFLEEAEENRLAEEYTLAIKSYQNALRIYPEKEFPKEQILVINAILKRNNDYNKMVADGDSKYAKGKYNEALFDYHQAKNLKPTATYPQGKIEEINGILTLQNAKEKNYQAELQKADSLFNAKSWVEAIDQYIIVIALKKDEPYPQKRLAEARQFLLDQKELDASYQAAIEKADAFFESESYTEARKAYLQANRIKPDEQYPLYKIEDINTIVEQRDIREIDNRYQELIASADKLFNQKAYPLALIQYKKANSLKPQEEYPPQQIAKIDQILALQSELDAKYNRFIKSADSAFYLENLEFARAVYVQAKEIKPEEDYPPAQISKIDALLSDLNDLEQNYQAAIARADASFGGKQYGTAKADYNLALTFKSDEAYPKQRIEEIDALLAQMNALEVAYQKAIQEGDRNFEAKSYLMAITNFQEALRIKEDAEYPKSRITAIELILANLDQLEKAYNQALEKADDLFGAKRYNEALPLYKEAQSLKPQEEYPLQQIAKINALLSDLNDLEQNYQAAIVRADASFDGKQYENAKADYNLALTFKSAEAYPKQRIEEIDALLAQMNALEVEYQKAIQEGDRNFEAKNYLMAITRFKDALKIKEDAEYPKSRITAIELILANLDQLDKAYNQALAKADDLFGAKQYGEALPLYKEAQNLKPQEEYPPQQIAKINALLSDLNALEAEYQKAIQEGDRNFEAKNYLMAITNFKEALKIKEDAEYPKSRIIAIELILANLDQLDKAYNQALAKAGDFFSAKRYNEALSLYKEAQSLKPEEEYPPQQIAKINILLSDLNNLEQNYQAAIARADASFDGKQYENAKADYNLALTFKPAETYPKQRIEEIDALLAQMNALEVAYQKAIQEGDRNFEAEEYLRAITSFKDALKIKENEEYPKTKIAVIESILAKLEQINVAYNQALAKADNFYEAKQFIEALSFYTEAKNLKPKEKYPPDQINRINSILAQQSSLDDDYNNVLTVADKLFNDKKYQAAISPYQRANQLKPAENYPNDQITKIREILAEREKYYNAFIKQGDDAYRMVNFQEAIVAYENALGVFPDQAYPKMMLDKIYAKIRRESVVSLVTSPETIVAGEEKHYAFYPIDYRDRQDNYILIEMKNASEERIRVFINFGKDSNKNGGYAVHLMQRDGYSKYFVRIDRQLRWKSEDNNWISLLPIGGDLEVKMIQISREEKSN